jgi:hypothetical protein
MRSKAVHLMVLLAAGALLGGCSEAPAPPSQPAAPTLGQRQLLRFQPDDQDYLADPEPFPLPPATPLPEVLQALARHLSKTYFAPDRNQASGGMRVDLQAIHYLSLPREGALTLVVVDLQDPDGEGLQAFFQGSSGAQTTFNMLAATLLQPQLDPPLADGLCVRYNGGPFPLLEHIDLRGIVTPAMVRRCVRNALYRRQRHIRPAA